MFPVHSIKYKGQSIDGRNTKLTLKFDCANNLLNPIAAARSSLVGWGEWQHSKVIPCQYGYCWRVITAGHGGYIMVTQDKVEWHTPILSLDHNVYIHQFEEDCEWAKLLYMDENIPQNRGDVIDILKRWYPNWLNEVSAGITK